MTILVIGRNCRDSYWSSVNMSSIHHNNHWYVPEEVIILLHVPASSAWYNSGDRVASFRSLLFSFSKAWLYASDSNIKHQTSIIENCDRCWWGMEFWMFRRTGFRPGNSAQRFAKSRIYSSSASISSLGSSSCVGREVSFDLIDRKRWLLLPDPEFPLSQELADCLLLNATWKPFISDSMQHILVASSWWLRSEIPIRW